MKIWKRITNKMHVVRMKNRIRKNLEQQFEEAHSEFYRLGLLRVEALKQGDVEQADSYKALMDWHDLRMKAAKSILNGEDMTGNRIDFDLYI